MSLKLFESRDAVPESLRESAVETKDGKFAVADVAGLKESKDKVLDEKKKMQERLEAIEKALGGKSADDVAKLLAERERADDEAARKAGDFDKLLEKRVNETKAEYDKRIAELAPYREKFIDREVEFAIRDAAIKGGVLPEDLPYIVDLHKGRRVRYDEKTGKVVVHDRDGDPTGLTVEKFYAETFKAEGKKFYGAEGGSGGGAREGGGGGSRLPAGQVAATDQNAFIQNLDKIAKGEVKVITAGR